MKAVDRFLNSYLRNDGALVVRMLTLHSGVIFGTELVVSLWQSYYGIEETLKRSNSYPDGDLPHVSSHDKVDSEHGGGLRMRFRPAQRVFDRELFEKLVPPSPPESMLRALKSARDKDESKSTSASGATPQSTQLSSPQHKMGERGDLGGEFGLGEVPFPNQNNPGLELTNLAANKNSTKRNSDALNLGRTRSSEPQKETRIGIDSNTKQPQPRSVRPQESRNPKT